MAKTTSIITNFTAGELSSQLDGRVDISRYYNGAKTLENFIILPYGGIKRRPGTYYVAEVADSTRKSRLIPFQFSVTQAYIIELSDRVARFYANNGQLLDTDETVLETTTPYLEADLFDLQFAQDADTMWIVHPSYKPRKLTRTVAWDTYTKLMLHCNGADALATFTDEIGKTVTSVGTAQMDTAQYKFGGASGLLDGNSDYMTLLDHADWNFGAGDFTIDFWVRFNAFDAGAGAYSFVSQYVNANTYWRFFVDSDKLRFIWQSGAVGEGIFITTNTCGFAVDTWYHIEIARNSSTCLMFIDGVSQAVTVTDVWGTHTNLGAILEIGANNGGTLLNGWIDELRISKGIARHTANFTPPTVAYAATQAAFTLKNYAPELLTLDVAPGGAWSAGEIVTGNTSGAMSEIVEVLTTKTYRIKDRSASYTLDEVLTNGTDTADQGAAHPTATGDPFGSDESDNCPSCVSIHEQRILFANTINNPQKIWGSLSGDYEDMTIGVNAGDAFVYVIGSEQVNAIRWLSSGRVLGMGTLGGVFSLSSGTDEAPITPTNVVVKRETSYGALGIVPKKIGNMTYYVQRNGKTIREFGYSYDIDEYSAFDTTLLAEHIGGDEITDIDYQQSPYNMLWCVRADGEIAILTRQIDQEVLAWSRIVTDGEFESVAIVPGDGEDDEVWVIVKRYINGAWVRYVEYFMPMDFGDEQEDAFFVDSGLSLDVPKTITDITQASPGVVTAVGHGFADADIVIIRGVIGMTEVNKTKYKVANKTDDTFELTNASTGVDVDTSAYTAYSSAGEVRKCVTSVSGLGHLVAETLDICIDGVEGVAGVVSGAGAITITTPTNGGGEMHAGMPYTSTLKTMRLEAGSQQGTAQSKLKRIQKTYVMIVDSLGMNIGNEDTMDAVVFDDDTMYSGWKDITFPSLWDRNGYIIITQDAPLPLNLLSIVIYLTTSDA